MSPDWSPRDAMKPCFQSDSLFEAEAEIREGAGRLGGCTGSISRH